MTLYIDIENKKPIQKLKRGCASLKLKFDTEKRADRQVVKKELPELGSPKKLSETMCYFLLRYAAKARAKAPKIAA